MLTQTVQDLESVREEAAAADDDLAQVVAEWKELALPPNNSLSESRNGTPGPKHSYDRS